MKARGHRANLNSMCMCEGKVMNRKAWVFACVVVCVANVANVVGLRRSESETKNRRKCRNCKWEMKQISFWGRSAQLSADFPGRRANHRLFPVRRCFLFHP